MNILYVSNNDGVLFLGVSLTSMFMNNTTVDELKVFIVDDGISEDNKAKLCKCAEKYDREIAFLEKPDLNAIFGMQPPPGRWPDNIFCRLFTPYLFRNIDEIKKVIYLDTDTIIAESLEELWNVDLLQYPCAAVLECMGDLHKKIIGIGKNVPYLNSGMILIDVNKWAKNELDIKCVEYTRSHYKRLEYPDESILNGVLAGNFLVLGPKYNLTTIKCALDYPELCLYRKSSVMYDEKDYYSANEHPTIIHFTNSFLADRPWFIHKKMEHPFGNLWLHYKRISLWNSSPLLEKRIGLREKIEKVLCVIPRQIVIYSMGLIYCYIKPMKYLIKNR